MNLNFSECEYLRDFVANIRKNFEKKQFNHSGDVSICDKEHVCYTYKYVA